MANQQSIVRWEHLVGGNVEELCEPSPAVAPGPPGLSPGLSPGPTDPQGITSSSGQSPFDNLTDLECHHAHLAVFLNYLVDNSDPVTLVSCPWA